MISTHTPLAGRDHHSRHIVGDVAFLLTRPLRGATFSPFRRRIAYVFLLTRPLRGATVAPWELPDARTDFYSHAPCGARPIARPPPDTSKHISTHTPLAGRDYGHVRNVSMKYPFLLTRPLRGATFSSKISPVSSSISTHTPLAGRDFFRVVIFRDDKISTHTPLAGRDFDKALLSSAYLISTHTPLAGRDFPSAVLFAPIANFYSHAPCGARHSEYLVLTNDGKFLLTRPLRGAT